MSQTQTTWTKTAKEGFAKNAGHEVVGVRGFTGDISEAQRRESRKSNTENFESKTNTKLPCSGNTNASLSSNKVANFGENVYIGKDINEMILTSDPNQPQPTLSPEEEKDIKNQPSMWEAYKDPATAYAFYSNGVSKVKSSLKNVKNDAAGVIGSWVYDNFDSPEAKKDLFILAEQISKWIILIPMSYLFVINWWYIMCYTDYVIDFRTWIFESFHWPMAPAFNALELLNYYTLTFRMDRNSVFPTIETSRRLWNFRPIVFSIFHLVMVLIMLYLPIGDSIEANMVKFGMLGSILLVISMYYYVKLFWSERWYGKFEPLNTIGSGMMLLGSVFITFLMMFGFISAICPVFILYIMVLSYFVIFIFNGFWPPSVYSVCNQIFQELKEAPVVYDKPTNTIQKLANAGFQNFHSIYLLAILVTFLTINIEQSLLFANESLIAIAIIANILICILFAPSAFMLPGILFGILIEGSPSEKPAPVGESGED